MNTCKTCKWWGVTEKHPTGAALDINSQRRCDNPHAAYGDPAGMVDGEDYSGVFTGPDFGCIHYEETHEQLPEDHPGREEQKAELDRRSEGMTQEEAWRTGMPYR